MHSYYLLLLLLFIHVFIVYYDIPLVKHDICNKLFNTQLSYSELINNIFGFIYL